MKSLNELIDPARTAIVVVDVQNDFAHPEGNSAKSGADTTASLAMIPLLQRFLDVGREFGAKIVFVQKVHEDHTDSEAWLARADGKPGTSCRKGSWGAEFIGVAPAANEPVVFSHRYSAFVNSRLDTVLRTYKIENLIMTSGIALRIRLRRIDRSTRVHARLQHRLHVGLHGVLRAGRARDDAPQHGEVLRRRNDLNGDRRRLDGHARGGAAGLTPRTR